MTPRHQMPKVSSVRGSGPARPGAPSAHRDDNRTTGDYSPSYGNHRGRVADPHVPYGPCGRVVRQGSTTVPRSHFRSRMIDPVPCGTGVLVKPQQWGRVDANHVVVRRLRGPVALTSQIRSWPTALDRRARVECHLDRAGGSDARAPVAGASSMAPTSVRPQRRVGTCPTLRGRAHRWRAPGTRPCPEHPNARSRARLGGP